MKKYQKILLVIPLFLIGTVAFAKNNSGEPFQDVWDAIQNLQDQITNIQLIPGPPGPQGPEGSPGPAGQPSWDEQRIASLEARVLDIEEILEELTATPTPSPTPSPTTILQDDFNSYSDGILNGQGGWWSRRNSNNVIVQENIVFEGVKAVKAITTGEIEKQGNQLASGVQGVYMRNTQIAGGEPYFGVRENQSMPGWLYFSGTDGHAYGRTLSGWIDLGTFSYDIWVWVQIEWLTLPNSHVIRYKVGDNNWSAWFSPADDWNIGPDTVILNMGGNGEAYWDYISGSPM